MLFYSLLASLLVGACLSFPFPDECGINYIEPDHVANASRIVGGFEAVPGSWPWQAYLIWKGSFICGGTLIHPQWVLSAGHCFYGDENAGHYKIRLGEHNDEVDEGWEQNIAVEKVIINPDYDDNEIDWDFTLVKLAEPAKLNDHVAPACFPSKEDDLETTFPPEQDCIVTGWGSIDPDGEVYGPVLKQDYAQLFSNKECGQAIGHVNWITDRMICAGFRMTGNDDPERCATLGYGDSGGPLVCRHPDTGRWTHIGAVSWGEFCVAGHYTPGVYANTINMRHWITHTLNQNL